MEITSAILSKESLLQLFFTLLSRHVFFFFFIRWRKGEDEGEGYGGQTLATREFGRCATLVIVMSLLRYISRGGRVPPSRVTGGSPAPIGSGTCPGRLWIASVIPQLSSHVLHALICSDADAWRLGIPSW